MSEKPSTSVDHSRLSRIETLWSVVRNAHQSTDEAAALHAQHELLNRYGGAIRKYLGAACRNNEIADDLFQEFAFKFIRGEFKSADPTKGRFRSFVKTILFRMVAGYFRKSNRQEKLVETLPDVPNDDDQQQEEMFLQVWREDVLNTAWEAMEQAHPVQYSVLRIKTNNPGADTSELSELLSASLEKRVSAGNARVMVHRARDTFANCLIDQVANSLQMATRESVEAELSDLRLLVYCQDRLDGFEF